MELTVGILAFGSLIDDPGKELAPVIVMRKPNVLTPFGVEFARSNGRTPKAKCDIEIAAVDVRAALGCGVATDK